MGNVYTWALGLTFCSFTLCWVSATTFDTYRHVTRTHRWTLCLCPSQTNTHTHARHAPLFMSETGFMSAISLHLLLSCWETKCAKDAVCQFRTYRILNVHHIQLAGHVEAPFLCTRKCMMKPSILLPSRVHTWTCSTPFLESFDSNNGRFDLLEIRWESAVWYVKLPPKHHFHCKLVRPQITSNPF